MKNKDLRLSIVLMVIFAILFAISFTFGHSDVVESHTTAAFFPRVVLIIAMFLTLIMMVQSVRNGPDAEDQNNDIDKGALKRVGLSMVISIAFGFGVSYLGTLVSISLFIIAIMLAWGVRSKRAIVLTALITPALIYGVFTKILYVQLPSGILI